MCRADPRRRWVLKAQAQRCMEINKQPGVLPALGMGRECASCWGEELGWKRLGASKWGDSFLTIWSHPFISQMGRQGPARGWGVVTGPRSNTSSGLIFGQWGLLASGRSLQSSSPAKTDPEGLTTPYSRDPRGGGDNRCDLEDLALPWDPWGAPALSN